MATTQNRPGEQQLDQAREQLNQGKEQFQQAASSAAQGIGQSAQNAASALTQKAQGMASTLGQKAQDTASNLGHKAQDLASTAQHKADDALTAMGERVSNMAGTIRSKAPHEGMVGSAASAVADSLDSTGRYLREHKISDIRDDVANLVRSHPIPSLLMVFGVGFLVGMAARRR